jgi:hypothetical protein
MACGSGAFLVQSCRYMSERLLEAWELVQGEKGQTKITPYGENSTGETNEQLIPDDSDERLVYARRIVAQRCLYGVDINPLATEMAKLSLWLLTLAKDKPFTFLDHSIRCGDSLVGITSIDQLKRFSLNGVGPQVSFAQEQIKRRIDAATMQRRSIERLPTNTVEDIERKTEMLKRAEEQTGRLRYAADMMLAVHWENLSESQRKKELRTTLMDVQFKFKDLPIHELQNEATERLASISCPRPFHWPVEFPEIFDQGGLSSLVCNPPFLGGTRISNVLGVPLNTFIKSLHPEGTKFCDLSAHFVRRAYELTRSDAGSSGLIATNTVGQGDSRMLALEPVVKANDKIIRASSSQQWPSTANVFVSVVHLFRGTWQGDYVLDESSVPTITPFLQSHETVGPPNRLLENDDKCFIGSKPMGMGWFIDEAEAKEIREADSKYSKVVLPIINGREINSNLDHAPGRWAITFHDWSLEKAEAFPLCMNVVRARVKPERDKIKPTNSIAKQRRDLWWKYSSPTMQLYKNIRPLNRVLARSRVSGLHMVAWVRSDILFNDAVVVFAFDDDSNFALLQSTIHETWIMQYASTLKSDVRYKPRACFECFVRPQVIDQLSEIGEEYERHRKSVLQENSEGLTKTYNRFHNPEDQTESIELLRQLHVKMDERVLASYGWEDIELKHDFYHINKKSRFTANETARREILNRLLTLNHERFEIAKRGNSKKTKTQGKTSQRKKTTKRSSKPVSDTLFDLGPIKSEFPNSNGGKLLCGLFCDLVSQNSGLSKTKYLEALVFVRSSKHYSKLLLDEDNAKLTKLIKKSSKHLKSIEGTSSSKLVDHLVSEGAIVQQDDGTIAVGK